ncbi:MAG TPA: response regulator transcription factor [Solirubrobacteraceae bacterium]|jgi:DNA-binding NarL/FixJ family response regulator|nr:response regulator transcription factor [Solirubrobacteraceae bacterium]
MKSSRTAQRAAVAHSRLAAPRRSRSVEAHGADHAPRSTRIEVLVVDDHPAVRWGLVQLLSEQPDLHVAAVATTAEIALAQAQHQHTDVAIVDYCLGGHNGLWVARKLKALERAPRVVIFSAYANDHLAASCAVAGADALISKSSLGDDVCHAIRSVWRGRRMIPRVHHATTGTLRDRLDNDRERMVFGMLLAGISDEQIARTLRLGARELAATRAEMLAKLEALPARPA